jgi:hypothetical protein
MSVDPPIPLEEKRCYSRLVSTGHFLYFGDGKHRFYLESRCPNDKLENLATCARCIVKVVSKYQYTSNYQHGLIYEPIPPHSHLYGGAWYEENAKKWGAPAEEDLAHAIRLQKEARMDLSKVDMPTIPKKMPRPRKQTSTAPTTVSEAPAPAPVPVPVPVPELKISTEIPQDPPTVKRVRRPVSKKLSPMAPVSVEESSTYPPSTSLPILTLFQPQEPKQEEPQQELQEEKKEAVEEKPRRGRKKKEASEEEPKKRATKKKPSSYEKLVHALPVIHKDSCIPTHKEEEMEEHSIEDYETEDVILSIFILDGTVYFRDAKKNKLYRRIKEKTIGQYVGRYDPYTDSLVTDVPDSDDEE